MIRLLLTCLAVLSGLVAEGAPAQARLFARGAAETRAEMGAVTLARGAAARATRTAPAAGLGFQPGIVSLCKRDIQPPLPARIAQSPAVRIRVDRALA